MSEIESIIIYIDADQEPVKYTVGKYGLTKITKTTRPAASGYHDVPYIEVWKGAALAAEFCQHHIVGVHFKN